MIEDTPFTPKQAPLRSATTFAASLGIAHVCIIACSIYGTDNACLVDALRHLKGKGRGIAYIDPETVSDAALDALHAVGVRGVRLNLWTRGQALPQERWEGLLQTYAARLRRLDWVLQVFVSMDQIKHLAPYIPNLGLKVVFDHLGCPNPGVEPSEQVGCRELYDLLKNNEQVYVKLSGAYRFQDVPGLDEHMRTLVDIAPNQVVWASDWPHTGGVQGNPGGDPRKEQEFMEVDDRGFLRLCLDMCGQDEALVRKIWAENPRRLWDYTDND